MTTQLSGKKKKEEFVGVIKVSNQLTINMEILLFMCVCPVSSRGLLKAEDCLWPK